jgi:hypothetical protein
MRWGSLLSVLWLGSLVTPAYAQQASNPDLAPGLTAILQVPSNSSVELRASPQRNGAVRLALGDGVRLRLLAGPVPADGITWYEVNYDLLGLSGWVEGQYLLPTGVQSTTFARFAGAWDRHGFRLQLTPEGAATATWRVYRWCEPGVAAPCDTLQDNVIIAGGRAAVAFTRADGDVAVGRIVATADPAEWPVGADVTLALGPNGMAELTVRGNAQLLCGPGFLNAPPEVVASRPCGA